MTMQENVCRSFKISCLLTRIFFLCLLQSSSPDRPDNNTAGELSGTCMLIIHLHINLVITVGMCGCNRFTPENRSSTGSLSKSDPGSPEKAHPRGDMKPEPGTRVKAAASSCSSPGGPVNPKPPVPQGTKPALAARPTIPVKPRTASNRSIGTLGSCSHKQLCVSV